MICIGCIRPKISVIFNSEIDEKVFLKSNLISAIPANFPLLLFDKRQQKSNIRANIRKDLHCRLHFFIYAEILVRYTNYWKINKIEKAGKDE